MAQADKKYKAEFFPPDSETERRISFTQSLTTEIESFYLSNFADDVVVETLLSLCKTICEEDQHTHVTLLEFLKHPHLIERENFVEDTMILAEESAMFNGVNPFANDENGGSKAYDWSFYFIGFKSAAPEFTLQTRIWAAPQAQTLYRTVSGMRRQSNFFTVSRIGSRAVVWWQY